MAARRFALAAVDWVAFAERVPPSQRSMFNTFKSNYDAISAKLAALPETAPAIDWSHYKAAVAKPGLVDEFEKKFNALKVPEPIDSFTSKINAEEAEANKSALEYIESSKARVAAYEKDLERFTNMIPFDEMTIDDLNEAFPETKLDKVKYPYWPHRPIAEL